MLAANDAAQGLGIYPAAAAARAQAVAADLIIQNADIEGDRDGLDKLALWALKSLSPIVAPDYPDGLVIDATGVSHLKGGESAYLKDLVRHLARVGVTARAAMSGSWGSAHALGPLPGQPHPRGRQRRQRPRHGRTCRSGRCAWQPTTSTACPRLGSTWWVTWNPARGRRSCIGSAPS